MSAPEQCVDCGRFMSKHDFEHGKHFFEPDNHFGPERSEWTCATCTALNDARCNSYGSEASQ